MLCNDFSISNLTEKIVLKTTKYMARIEMSQISFFSFPSAQKILPIPWAVVERRNFLHNSKMTFLSLASDLVSDWFGDGMGGCPSEQGVSS